MAAVTLKRVFSCSVKIKYPYNFAGYYDRSPLMRWASTQTETSKKASKGKFKSLHSGPTNSSVDKIDKIRQIQAENSVLIQHPGPGCVSRVISVCLQHGHLKSVHNLKRNKLQYSLVEFSSSNHVDSLLKSVDHRQNSQRIVVQSRFLMLRSGGISSHARNKNKNLIGEIASRVQEEDQFDEKEMWAEIEKGKDLSHQMEIMHKELKMTEIGFRLRYLLIQSIEDMLRGIFHKCEVVPFGSCVNGFGRHDCDIDILFSTEPLNNTSRTPEGDLFFKTKHVMEDKRRYMQESLDTIGAIIRHFMPEYVSIRKILHARVPIIKFKNTTTKIECDLTMDNRVALEMSDLLFLFGEYDSRVRPLMFAVRYWAKSNDLTTRSSPGPQMSNFSLTMLVIYFLQTRNPPVLPSINKLREIIALKSKTRSDSRSWKDFSDMPLSENKSSSGDLLKEFFEFYSVFNFKDRALSLVKGQEIDKPLSMEQTEYVGEMYIENPLETDLCVSKNVSEEEVNNFVKQCIKSLEHLKENTNVTSQSWGLSKITPNKTTFCTQDIVGNNEDSTGTIQNSEIDPSIKIDVHALTTTTTTTTKDGKSTDSKIVSKLDQLKVDIYNEKSILPDTDNAKLNRSLEIDESIPMEDKNISINSEHS